MSKSILDAILAADDLPHEDVIVPEWDNRKIRIRTLTGAERDAWEFSIVKIRGNRREIDPDNIRARLLVLCMVDPDTGLNVANAEHAAAIGAKSSNVIGKLYDIAARLNGLSAGAVDELGKGSALAQSAGSGSG